LGCTNGYSKWQNLWHEVGKLTRAGYYWASPTHKPVVTEQAEKPKDDWERFNIKKPSGSSEKTKDDDFYLWYDNVADFNFFLAIQNYWLIGYSSVTGLNHAAVIERIKLFESSRTKQQQQLEAIEAIEQGALQAWADTRAEEEANKKDTQFPLSLEQRNAIKNRRQNRC
jgi:hypothetical protein